MTTYASTRKDTRGFHFFMAMSSTGLAMKHISQGDEFSSKANLDMLPVLKDFLLLS